MPHDLLAWSPALIGFTVSIFMYGTALGQSIYYSYWFPNDPPHIRILVFAILWVVPEVSVVTITILVSSLADTVHLIASTQLFWTFFVSCHGSNSWSCNHELPWGMLTMTCLNSLISVTVQCFYGYRIWIISGKNKYLTLAVFVLAGLELVSGTWYNINVSRVGTIQHFFQCPLILPIAGAGILCDIVITGSIFRYMWRSHMWRSGFRRQRTIIQDLALVCINMGAFTCIISIATGVMFLIQGTGYWVASVGIVISQSYVNSMMAVLNARRVIRDLHRNEPDPVEFISDVAPPM